MVRVVQLRDDLGLAGVGEWVEEDQDRGGDEEGDARVERLEGLDPEQGPRGLLGVGHIPDEGEAEPGEPARAASAR